MTKPKAIRCPRCEGKGRVMVTIKASGFYGERTDVDCCPLCDGELTIPDRRAADERDAAFERAREAWAYTEQDCHCMTVNECHCAERERESLAILDAYFNPAKEG